METPGAATEQFSLMVHCQSEKQKVDDPTYELVQWAVANKHKIFRQFFPKFKAKEPLECEFQYIIKQMVGEGYRARLNKSKLGYVDLVIYEPSQSHPDRRVHRMSAWQHTLYIKVEAIVPPMDKIMRELQDLSFYLERVPKERVALLAPPTELDVGIRSQGFSFIEFSPDIELNEEEPLSPRV